MIDLASHGWNLWMARMWLAVWQGGLLALLAYGVTRLVPTLSPRTRTALWWCVSAKFLVTLLATTPVRLGLLPVTGSATVVPGSASLLANVPPSQSTIVSLMPSSQAAFPWAGLVWAVWLVGFLFLVKRLIRQHRKVSELIQRSHAVTDPQLRECMNKLATAMGLRRPVSLRSCVDLDAPVITGLRHPIILFPASALSSLEESPLRLALAHELAHLKRRDLLWSWVPVLANTVFWFFPASWLSMREYSQAREEACDAEALRVTRGQPDTYARLLLAFGTCHQPWAASAACGASPHFHHLKRRLTMLQRFSVNARDRTAFAFAALGALLLVPIHVVAREAKVSQAPIVVAEAPPVPPAPGAVPPIPPAPDAVPPVPPIPPVLLSSVSHERHTGHSENRDPYVYVNGDSVTMSASSEDLRRVDSLKSKYGSQFLWFRRGSNEYVITDASTLKAIDTLQAPQKALGRQQGELGKKQGALGHEQGELGRKQGALGKKQAEIGKERGQMTRSGPDSAKEANIASKRTEIDLQSQDLAREQADLGRQQAELGRRQAELGQEQSKLGKQQGEIGRQVQEKIAQTLEAAVANGIAKPATP